ncbi:pyridoxal-phosphate dependent enzyme [Rhodocaloribacter litoris]|uniref:threonine ammonia-lyase n=1 Tax=Rhodocaloribacter litoris TaxID=2558931 RepID=UPI00141E809B|nr:pyridoxal-phosphate dependent enzyme [Rhodocaloribacter litoris]QXD14369.1 pyridoxal-phosphate dependent enzyme [Rhodocaloribacter litoris]GIV60609.1 MAG: serine/threonine dehydratase [Rhodothermaceae bacterium]
MTLDLGLIDEAVAFLDGQVRRTPVEPAPLLSARLGVPVYLKLECLQLTGSFKVRGALFALSKLSEADRRHGVATCSAGNHGIGLAHAAHRLGIPATIYVPAGVDEAKLRAIEALGARVVRSAFSGYDATEAWARQEAARAGLPFLSAYDDPHVMAGNGGTVAAEVLADVPEARTFLLPVGGGGLAGGFGFYVKERLPDARLVACQLAASPALLRSLERGAAVTEMPPVETVAGGLEGGLGVLPFAVLRDRVDHVALVPEQDLREGVRWMLDHHRYLVEPSAAVTVAACLAGDVPPPAGPVVVLLSGRNVSLATLRNILA